MTYPLDTKVLRETRVLCKCLFGLVTVGFELVAKMTKVIFEFDSSFSTGGSRPSSLRDPKCEGGNDRKL